MTRKIRSAALGAAAALTVTGIANAQSATAPEDATGVVLVHGTFNDGSGWRGIYDRLIAKISHLDRAEPADLAQERCRCDQSRDRAPAGARHPSRAQLGWHRDHRGRHHPKVAGLVYVSALAPDTGETTAKQYEGFPAATDFAIDTQDDGFGFVNPDKFKAGFAADVSDSDAAFLRGSQVPIHMSCSRLPSPPLPGGASRSGP